ncbi:ERAD-associated protein, partial [Massospora cicadina]
AMLHHTFAARAGHSASQMVLGFRYLNGIGAANSCPRALSYYYQAAQTAMNFYYTGPPGGLSPPRAGIRLSDFDGGVFGERAKGKGRKAVEQEVDELIEYYRYMATSGNLEATYILGEMYYQGTRTITRDFAKAGRYLQRLEEKLEALGPASEWEKANVEIGAQAYALLGRMHLRGESFPPNNKTALAYFKKAAEHGNEEGLFWLGMMLIDGGIAKTEGIKYLAKAAEKKHAEANAHLGMLYRDAERYAEAHAHLRLAAQRGSLLATFHLARFYVEAGGGEGVWNYDHTAQAYLHYRRGEIETAAIYYSLAAEMGIEVAQANLAWLIDIGKHPMPSISRAAASNSSVRPNYRMALTYWTRSANQDNGESRVKQGDYYYYGLATAHPPSTEDLKRAASCYQYAAEKYLNSLAMWNIGWMHENGVGVPLDFHLAKRYYDDALVNNPDASLPVSLSLIKLGAKFIFNYLFAPKHSESLISFFQPKSPVQDPPSQDAKSPTLPKEPVSAENGAESESSAPWLQKRVNDDDDWGGALPYERLRSQKPGESIVDEYEASGYNLPDDDDDPMLNNILIIGLCVLVGWLVYQRQFGANAAPPAPPVAPLNPEPAAG